MWAKERIGNTKRDRRKQTNINVENILLQGRRDQHVTHFQFKGAIKLTLTVISSMAVRHSAPNGRWCGLDRWSRRQPGCAAGHWWKFAIC